MNIRHNKVTKVAKLFILAVYLLRKKILPAFFSRQEMIKLEG